MVEKKTKSHRLTLHKKYKIESKIKAHHRKIRRAARQNKDYIRRKQKRDPGIPNSWPFKQEMMEEALQNKLKAQELQTAQRNARRAEQDRRRQDAEPTSAPAPAPAPAPAIGEARRQAKTTTPHKAPIDIAAIAADAAKRAKAHAGKEAEDGEVAALAQGFNGIPGTTMQAYYREFRKVVDAADIILEVLDARDPLGCRCPDVERMIVTNYPGKRIVLILTKIDLAPREVVAGWLAHLRNEYPTIAFKSSRQNQRKLGQKATPVALATNADLQGASALGADTLLQLLKHYATSGRVKTSVTVGIVGFPNVGKSSLINSLCRSRAVNVGATPGVTRAAQEVHLDKHVKLLDSPGIVFPKASDSSDDIILRHAVQIEKVADPVAPVQAIVAKCSKEVLLRTYSIPTFADAHEFLRHVARAHGKVGKGGVMDVQAAARRVIQDWVSGKIPFYTEPPVTDKAIHVAASVVSEFGKEFDLQSADEDILGNLPSVDMYEGQALQAHTAMPQTAPLFLYTKPPKAHTPTDPDMADAHHDSDGGEDGREDGAEDGREDGAEDELDFDDSDLDEDDDEDENMVDAHPPAKPKSTAAAATPKQVASAKKKGAVVSAKQNLATEEDQYNPQLNRAHTKAAKAARRKARAKAQRTAALHDDADRYNFATDFAPDNAHNDNDHADIDLADIEDDE